MHFNNITRLYGSIYARLPCKPGKKAACLREGDYEAGHAITHVQTHVQSTVIYGMDDRVITLFDWQKVPLGLLSAMQRFVYSCK